LYLLQLFPASETFTRVNPSPDHIVGVLLVPLQKRTTTSNLRIWTQYPTKLLRVKH